MNNNVVIACQTLRDEIEKAMEETGCNFPIVWVESNFHVDPHRLRNKLQQKIDELTNIDNVLFVYGSCGNGLVGLKASTANLIIPKTEDCISLVLTKPKESFRRLKETYFLTKGWIESPNSIFNEYSRALNRYGEQRAKRLFNIMLRNYNYLMLIDTGAYSVREYADKITIFAKNLNLKLIFEKGDLWLLRKLLTGPYDCDFCVVPKGNKVKVSHFGVKVKD